MPNEPPPPFIDFLDFFQTPRTLLGPSVYKIWKLSVSTITKYLYSTVPNKQVGPNSRGVGKILKIKEAGVQISGEMGLNWEIHI